MSIAQEEVFGPVAPIIVAHDKMEAIELANDSECGLGHGQPIYGIVSG